MIEASHLSKVYSRGVYALRDLSLTIGKGEFLFLTGASGAGKSTLLRLLLCAETPSEGTLKVNGRELTGLPASARTRAGLGRAFQLTNLFPNLSVLENVRLAAQSRRQQAWRIFSTAMRQQWALDKARACIDEAGLGSRTDWIAGVLSHGEQRQLEIAMVLATDARVLLLDEPLAGMGSDESAQMVELLKRLRENRAILLVEHDMDAVFAVADTITVLVNGQVLESGDPDTIRRSPAVQQAYLGHEGAEHV